MNNLFRGAGVIIDYPGQLYTNDEADICVETQYARELSNIYFKLGDYFYNEIDYLNKYNFYGRLAENYNRLIEKNGDIKENLQTFLLLIEGSLYFAYGSNMNKKQMDERCHGSIYVGVAYLQDYKFALDSSGTASIVPNKGSIVEGALWLLNPADEKELDKYEGVNIKPPCYIKQNVNIELNNEKAEALVYISNRDALDKPIRKDYIQKVYTASIEIGLSKKYIQDNLAKYLDE